MKTLGFIGMGNMAGAIASGIIQKGLMKKDEVFAYAPHYDKLVKNAEKIGFTACKELKELVAKTDTLIMACKPYQIEDVLSEIKEDLKGKALISIAAGWNYDKYQEFLDGSTRLQFIMPNTPAMVGEGVLLFEEKNSLLEEERAEVKRLFEALGIVRDGSKSTTKKCVYAKGYHVTEACVLTDSNHPASIYSRIHSSHEKGFTSVNHITFEAIDRSVKLLKNATFVMDRGYDDNKMFQKLWNLEQDFVICLTQKRKLFFHGKWVPATKLCAERKGKVKMNLFYKGKAHEAYISHVKVQLTAAKKNVYLVLVYGITEHPMMLVTSKAIRSKDDVVKVSRLYFSRWRIEEYFRAKKQILDFENFRVRSLVSINALNFHITIAMTFLAQMTRKAAANALLKSVLDAARSIKGTVHFLYYRISYGIAEILKYARVGIYDWFKPKRTDQNQLRFRLSA